MGRSHALEGPDRLPPGLPVDLHPAVDICLGRRVESRLGERDDVERAVELTVGTPVEAHALDLPGTRRDRRHAGKCGKGVRGSKTPDVSNLGDEPSDGDRSRPRQPEERVPRDTRTEPSFEHLDLPLKASQADQERAGELGLDRGVPPQESGDLRSVARRHEVGDRPAIARHKDK